MAISRTAVQFVYGIGDNLLQLPPQPIVARRAPTTRDLAQVGTLWVDEVSSTIYGLASITSNSANWVSTPAAGATVVASLQVTGAAGIDVDVGDVDITLGDLNIPTGDATIGGNLSVAGVTTITGDLDLTSTALIDLTSTLNAAPSIYLHANGGALEQIRIHADQGTSVNSIELDSDVGGITLVSGLASDDAINLSATAGGVDIDGALQVNISSSENAADALVLNSSAGGLDITAAGAAGEDIDIVNTAGSINLNSGEVIADSMVLTSAGGLDFSVAGTGGLDIDMVNTSGSINVDAGEAAADAIVINASDAAGGLQLQAGSNGILIGNQADCAVIDVGDVVPTSARTITVGGGAVATAIADTIDIGPDGATTDAGASKVVNINSGNLDTATLTVNIGSGNRASGTHAVNISSGTGTKTVNVGNADGLTTVNIDAITLINDSLNVNTSINTGTSTGVVAIGNGAAGAITLDSGAGISLDGGAASNFSVSGAGIDLTLASAAGRVVINGEEAAADAVRILSAAGGLDADVALQMNLVSSQAAAADSVRIQASAADGGIDIDSGTGGLTLDSTGAVSIAGAAASDFSVSGAGIDLSLVSAAGRVIVNGEEAAADAITLLSAAGGLDANVALQMNFDSSQAAADAIRILASDAAGGIDIDSGTGGIALDSTAAFSIDGATASNVTVTGASQDLTLSASGGSVNVTATEAAADAIVLNASDASGGIDLLTGGGEISLSSSGNVAMVPATATEASPTATATINARVGVATFTGFTTAAGANEDFTITNSALGAGDGVFVTVSNTGSNDADMTLEGVITETAGSLVIHTQNNGPAALNGNVIIAFWIIN